MTLLIEKTCTVLDSETKDRICVFLRASSLQLCPFFVRSWLARFSVWYFSYNGAITKCVTAIIVLKRKCKEYQQGGQTGTETSRSQPNVMGPPAQVRALKGPGTRESSRSSSNETEQEVRVFLPDTMPQVARYHATGSPYFDWFQNETSFAGTKNF